VFQRRARHRALRSACRRPRMRTPAGASSVSNAERARFDRASTPVYLMTPDFRGDGVRRITAPPGLMTPTEQRMVGVPHSSPSKASREVAPMRGASRARRAKERWIRCWRT
jgi:hypothetical protein